MTVSEPESPSTVLIWEDATDAQAQWWVSRVQHLGHELVIAEDDFSNSILLLGRPGGRTKLSVISAFRAENKEASTLQAKAAAVRWVEHTDTSDLRWQKWRWQAVRGLRLWLYDMPLIFLAIVFGIIVGWLVGVFFDTTGQRGLWTVLFGLVIGAALGPVLTHVINTGFGSKRSRAYRGGLVMICAGIFGAGTVALMVLPNA